MPLRTGAVVDAGHGNVLLLNTRWPELAYASCLHFSIFLYTTRSSISCKDAPDLDPATFPCLQLIISISVYYLLVIVIKVFLLIAC
jgi:hypothetical protein